MCTRTKFTYSLLHPDFSLLYLALDTGTTSKTIQHFSKPLELEIERLPSLVTSMEQYPAEHALIHLSRAIPPALVYRRVRDSSKLFV